MKLDVAMVTKRPALRSWWTWLLERTKIPEGVDVRFTLVEDFHPAGWPRATQGALRNRALAAARDRGADGLVWVDDDDWWSAELLEVLARGWRWLDGAPWSYLRPTGPNALWHVGVHLDSGAPIANAWDRPLGAAVLWNVQDPCCPRFGEVERLADVEFYRAWRERIRRTHGRLSMAHAPAVESSTLLYAAVRHAGNSGNQARLLPAPVLARFPELREAPWPLLWSGLGVGPG